MSRFNKIKGKSAPKMKRGFSLVELMIVVAILGILAAIVVPQFQSHATEAKAAAAKGNLHTLSNSTPPSTTASHPDTATTTPLTPRDSRPSSFRW